MGRTITREDQLVAGLAALAISIHLLEAAIPMPLPGVKPGLANVVVLVALLRFGFAIAAEIAMLRVIAGSLVLGSFMTPTFWLSASGAIASLLAIGLAYLLARRMVGILGYAVLASMAHITGQLLVAWLVLLPHPGILALLPLLLTIALGLGIFTGIIAASLIERLPPRAAATPEGA